MDKLERQKEKKRYRFGKLFCIECTYANTYDADSCFKCGSTNLTRDKKLVKKQEIEVKNPFIGSGMFYYLISLGISIIISTGIILGIASAYLVVKGIIAALLILSSALILSFFVFVFIRVLTKKESRKK